MCGVVGLYDSRGQRPIDAGLLRRMNDSLAHRGPDGDGIHIAPGIGLGHRRLAIIDVACGQQPLFNEDGTVAVVFNGEIYNFQDMVGELKAAGHIFRTHSDTEVIVHGWEEWGEDCLLRFRGMFAFALWDAKRETLFLARDRLGKKPLYYAFLNDGLLLFGSELKALLVHPDLPRKLDPQAVEEYFAYGYVPDPRTIYQNVHKLPPAHSLTLRRGVTPPAPKPYWNLSFQPQAHADIAAAERELIERLREAVRLRLISEVPLGAFLSGGVDSSGVVALMAGVSAEPVNTFAISFAAKGFDESRFAADIAGRYHTNHRSKQVDPEAFDLLDRLATMYDEPFGDSSALPTYQVCAMAREGVTVALSGDGGDELFAGYRRYRWQVAEERLRRLLPRPLRAPLFGALGRLYPKLDWAPRALRAKTTLQELALDSAAAFFSSVSVMNDGMRAGLYSAGFKRSLAGYHAGEVLAGHMRAADSDDPLAQAQYADIKTWLPGDILTKVDRASMAASLEVRVPMLDQEFVEWSAGLPAAWKLHGGEGKHLLKRALEPFVPRDILYRPKQGFSLPLAAWFRGPLRARVRDGLTGAIMGDSGLFDMDFIGNLVEQHQSGRRDHAPTLWSLLAFEAFLRQVHEGSARSMEMPVRAAGG